MNFIYDLFYVLTSTTWVILSVYLIRICHLFIVEKRWPKYSVFGNRVN